MVFPSTAMFHCLFAQINSLQSWAKVAQRCLCSLHKVYGTNHLRLQEITQMNEYTHTKQLKILIPRHGHDRGWS